MAKAAGLGRGLSALFGDEAVRGADGGVSNLRISEVEPRLNQPRQAFDEVLLNELAESIRQHGVLQPLAVRRLPTGYYQIIAGERRWRAAKIAGLTEIPAVVFDADDRHATEMALIENLQREDLNPIEEADGFRSLINEYGLTQEEVAARVGRSRPAVANSLRLLGLTEKIKSMVIDGRLSAGHARSLLPVSDSYRQEEFADTIINKQLSVRQAEAMVKQGQEKPAKQPQPNYVDDYQRHLCKVFGRKVIIKAGARRGRVELEFYSPEDLELLMKMLLDAGGGYNTEGF